LAYAECDLYSGLVTEQQVLQISPKGSREQPGTSAKPKVATVRAPNATIWGDAPKDVPKKGSTRPRPDVEKERKLFKEFLEWRGRQVDL